MNRVLVTGAAGGLGRAVVEELARQAIATTGLVLSTSDTAACDRVVVGNAGDPAVVIDALRDADAVIHLAAIPAPHLGTSVEVFCGNTAATFTVLEHAAVLGIRRAVIASSYSVTGLPFAPRLLRPAYLPIDEALPLQVEDAYALSKHVDELTANMMWRRHGLSVVALRLPFLGDPELRLPVRAAEVAAEPLAGVRDFWSYLDYRDAARACVAGLTDAPAGCHVVGLAAPFTLSAYPTEDLLDTYLPEVPRRAVFPGRTVPFDLARAAELLAFEPIHLWPVEEKAMP